MITIGTTPGAPPFTTGTTTIEAEMRAANPTVPAQRPGPLKETITPLEDTLNAAVKAVLARAPSAATTTAERQGAIHRAEVPASVAEQRVVAVSRIGNRRIVMFLVASKI